MNLKERFLEVMAFDTDVVPPLWEFGYWAGTIKRWRRERIIENTSVTEAVDDLPDGIGVGSFFHISAYETLPTFELNRFFELDDPVNYFHVEAWIYPKFESRILERLSQNRKLVQDEYGIEKITSDNEDSIPHYSRWPVESENDWESFKYDRLNPKASGRLPQDIDGYAAPFEDQELPLEMGGWPIGFFGSLRYLMGEMKLLTGFYDNPSLIKKIISHLTDFWIELFDPVLDRIVPDYFRMWEDMCFKTGPFISPAMFREFMLPAYRKFTGFLKSKGVRNILVDTDGNCWKLIPLFLEAGVTGIFPMEVAAGMDVVAVRNKYPKLQILGGIDKIALIDSKSAIDRELDEKIPVMLKQGGYIPFVDHFVSPDISLDNFLYYRAKLNRMLRNPRGIYRD